MGTQPAELLCRRRSSGQYPCPWLVGSISKNKDRDIPHKSPRDIPIKCLCLCAFWVPRLKYGKFGAQGLEFGDAGLG